MNLGEINKAYWQKYNPGTTPSINEVPDASMLSTLNPGANILDIGTGTGILAESLASLGYMTYGIDVNPQEIVANDARNSSVHYSVQDITDKTNFEDSFFDLVIFRYTLTNIHRPDWSKLAGEVGRILADSGQIWLAEPLVNDGYALRYELASRIVDDNHAAYVFKDKRLARQIKTADELKVAIATDRVSRIIRHYTEDEVTGIFNNFEVTNLKQTSHVSPSGFDLPTLVMNLKKTS